MGELYVKQGDEWVPVVKSGTQQGPPGPVGPAGPTGPIAPRSREEVEIPTIANNGDGYDAWISANGGLPPIGINIPATWRAGGVSVGSAFLGVWNKIPPANTRWSFTYNSHLKTGTSNNDNENYDFQPYETKCGKFIANGTSTFGQLVGGPSANWVHVLLTRYA